MSVQIGDKYIIEIGAIAELPNGKKKYFIKPFESLVFDRKGLEQLEKLEKATGYIYQTGYSDGYDNGVQDASDLLAYADSKFINECFPNESNWDLFDLNNKYGLAVIIKEFKKWQKQNKQVNEEIKIGDEVISPICNKAIVTMVDDDNVMVVYNDGSCGEFNKETFRKTGRNFSAEIEQLLDKLRGEDSD